MGGRRIAALLLRYQDNKHQTTAPQSTVVPAAIRKRMQKQSRQGEKGRKAQEYEIRPNNDYVEEQEQKNTDTRLSMPGHDVPLVSDDFTGPLLGPE